MIPFFSAKRPTMLAAYDGYRNEQVLHLRVRVLKHRPLTWEARGGFRKFLKMMRLYTSREVAGVTVRLEGLGLSAEAVSDKEGYAVFDLSFAADMPLPTHTQWEHVTLTCSGPTGETRNEARILAPGRDGRLAVISDVDDTIIETGAHAFIRNWRRILAELPADRLAVPGAASFYKLLARGSGADDSKDAPRRPFFYISSSPWNLYGFLLEFKRRNNLPSGPMLLRDWGFNRRTLGKASHGAHKERSIAEVLNFYPHLRFVLIGDDTQGDARAFADAVQRFPDRIAAVLIRTATGAPLTEAKREAMRQIEASATPVWVGNDFDEGHNVLKQLGFTPGGETATVLGSASRD